MRAVDVMVRDVVTICPDTDVAEAIRLLAEHDVSALPVVDPEGNLVGVLSEADLIHRVEIGTEKHRPWCQETVVSEDTPLSEIATLFEHKGIKRVPVVKDGKLVGIVSRSNLIQALASVVGRMDQHDETDRQIRLELMSRLQQQSWTDFGSRNVTVSDGVVHLWGLVGSQAEHKALLALAETVPGVSRVADEMIPAY